MKQYLLSIYQPVTATEAELPSEEFLAPIVANLDALNKEMREAGAWVFAAGLHPTATATVVRYRDDEALVTDGPYVEGKEHLGGFTVVRAPDLDAALEWGRKLARATTLPVEVRPMEDGESC
ncbi:YciI family protein [Streptomyces sp. NPDC048172]|uniref:YciI family protein n=1 Tax=Streptomyces sp. NPDC048172 TaxID=3365505 RepID=UPI0037249C97